MEVLLDLVHRFMSDDTLCFCERLLTTMFLESIADIHQTAASLIPSPPPTISAIANGHTNGIESRAKNAVNLDDIPSHINSLKELVLLMVKMLEPEKQDKPLICRIMPLIADVCMIFLRCLVRSVQEEWEATPLPSPQNLLFSQCLCPIVE